MSKDFNENDNKGGQENHELNRSHDNRRLQEDKGLTPDGLLPEDDPAVINPDELASFPKEKHTENPDIEDERDPKLVNRKTSPVREGRNITRTGPGSNVDEDGFM